MSRYRDIKEECYETNVLLPKIGLVDLTFGNASVIDRAKGVFAIKPTGIPYADLTPDSMILLDMKGRQLESRFRRSSDAVVHCRLFKAFPQIRAIVHTHSRNAVGFAQAGRGIPSREALHSDHFHGEIPVTRPLTANEVRFDYDRAIAHVILERFAELDPLTMPGILLHGHGPYTWGSSGAKAAENAFVLERIAEFAAKNLHQNPQVTPFSLPREKEKDVPDQGTRLIPSFA